ncbi:GIY-YIG nuclease family protein [Phaeodactylibacter luteus]|uniref:GIY-YIG nuclease family protein n=1 Tax=Phaeodactylibacter luteus TaxID=1564516 RepID=A0A5C6RI64_9BACT|nr:GIY-YIG nuclease family protein [Phaeodactylibacter luteus]TXB61877.1 GIY-YIG nuclease family protein [Phaeodactylibacter luteus]
MFYTYILYSPSADRYYIGHTQDLALRLRFHNELGEGTYTSKHRPWELSCTVELQSRSAAFRLEQYIKQRKSRAFIEQFISVSSYRSYIVEKICL